jgi:hypothetical protein
MELRLPAMEEIGKILLLFGGIFLIVGGLFMVASKIPGFGHLPGDIVVQTENLSCIFPIATSIVLSIALTVILNLLLHILNK